MSSAAHREALRASLSSYFRGLTTGVTDAARVKQIVDELKEASGSLLSELVSEWHLTSTSIYRIPEEVLAQCFALLPFVDRISASHVSRRWRYVALAYPAIWALVELEDGLINKPALLRMALDRTGNVPVDVLNCPASDMDGLVDNSLAAHIYHMRSLHHTTLKSHAFLHLPAPMLEILRGGEDSVHLCITPDFLGGQTGQLRSLHAQTVSFPATCPALSAITNLAIHAPATTQDAAHFDQLFRLCPALESLALLNPTSEISSFAPVGPAPASLRHVLLGSSDDDYDLTVYYAMWGLNGLDNIVIYQAAEAAGGLIHMISGAFRVEVRREPATATTAIIALGPLQSRREVEYWEDDDDQHVLAELMLSFQDTLTSIHAMTIPATSLSTFLAVFAVLPSLVRLEVTMQEADDGEGAHAFPWDMLAHLSRMPDYCPGLQLLVLNVVCAEPHCYPSALDAENLLDRLNVYAHVILSTVMVNGFPTEALRGVQIPEFEGFKCVFAPQD